MVICAVEVNIQCIIAGLAPFLLDTALTDAAAALRHCSPKVTYQYNGTTRWLLQMLFHSNPSDFYAFRLDGIRQD